MACRLEHEHIERYGVRPESSAFVPSPSNDLRHRRIRDEQLRIIRTYLEKQEGNRMKSTIARVALTVFLLLGLAGLSSAQPKPPAAPARRAITQAAVPVRNPTGVMFTCPDHALDDGHEVDIIDSVTGAVLSTVQGGDPAADAQGNVTIVINVQPIKFGTYVFVVRAKAGTNMSPNSPPSEVWQRSPGAPGIPVAK